MLKKIEKKGIIDLSVPRRKYFADEHNLTFCPECNKPLIEDNCTIIIHAESSKNEGEFMSNMSGSRFCNDCPVVVFDREQTEKAAEYGLRDSKNLKYMILGIVDMDAIPKEKRHLPMGDNDNPIPLVEFLPEKNTKTIISDKKPGRNDPCPCGSAKKYKKCCGK